MSQRQASGPVFLRDRGDRVLAVVLLAIVGLFVLLVIWGIPQVGHQVTKWVPPAWERKLGDSALKSVVVGKAETGGVRVGMVEAIVKRLTPDEATWSFRVTLAPGDTRVNAMALPGGAIVVTQGLLERCSTPEELAGVLAHEIVHVQRRHGLQRMGQELGIQLLLLVLTGGDPSDLWSGAAGLAGLHHSRQAEDEADKEGLALMLKARIDPQGMVRSFRMLQKLSAESEATALPAFLSDHPAVADRLARIEAEAARHAGPWEPITLDRPWLNVRFPASRR
ncbi:MAG: M48 family metallopeptidase [Candidatus Sericytochromatia bacterium]|nr:M48 family metallopeptidase [Candidatus Sericytochromatia bacterium]